MKIFRGIVKGILLKGENTDPSDNKEGSVWHNRVLSRLKTFIEGDVREILTDSQAQTLTNKTISANDNTIIDLEATQINYDNSVSGLNATNVQDALDENTELIKNASSFIVSLYDPVSTSLPTGTSAIIDGISVQDGDRILFSNLSVNNNRVYEVSGVGVSLVFTPVPLFAGSLDPIAGTLVTIQDGLLFQMQSGRFTGLSFDFNRLIKQFNGTDYVELSSPYRVLLPANTITSVFEVTAVNSENWVIDASVLRGSAKETFSLIITVNGSNVEISKAGPSISVTNVSFDADINLGTLRLRASVDNSSGDASIILSYKRWSDSIGGPASIPSYSSAPSPYANLSLSNLTATAINQSLIPATDNTIDLGVSGTTFREANINTINALDIISDKVRVIDAPVLNTDATNKLYVDAAVNNLVSKYAVKTLSVDEINNSDITDLKFYNLELGKYYKVTVDFNIQTVTAPSLLTECIVHNGLQEVIKIEIPSDNGLEYNSSNKSMIFQSTNSDLSVSINNGSRELKAGSKLMIEEISTVLTTQWDNI